MEYKIGRKVARVVVDGMLPCSKCKQMWPIREFAREARRVCGYRSQCNVCRGKAKYRIHGVKKGFRKSPETAAGEKWCYGCKLVKPLSVFHSNRRMKDGHSSECKACGVALAGKRRERKRIAELSATTTASLDECAHHIAAMKCRPAKAAKQKKIQAEFACVNCGLLSRRKGGKYCSTKCAVLVAWRVQKHVRRARKRGIAHETIDLPNLLARDKFKCGICAKAISVKHRYPHPLSPSIDHIIPLSKGGSHTWVNVQASHHECNQLKRAKAMGQLRIC